MKHHQNRKYLGLGVLLMICLSLTSYGFWQILIAPEEDTWTCTHSPTNSIAGIEVKDQSIIAVAHPNNTAEIYYITLDLIANTSVYPAQKYFVDFNDDCPNTLFYFYLHTQARRRGIELYRSLTEVNISNGWSYPGLNSVSWIEWIEQTDQDDHYLNPSERARIHIYLGKEDRIEWGDTLTLRVKSRDYLNDVAVKLIVKLPAEYLSQENQLSGQYSGCHSEFY